MEKHSELLLLPDGRIFVHNLTPAMAELLHQFDPRDGKMKRRARAGHGAGKTGTAALENRGRMPRKTPEL